MYQSTVINHSCQPKIKYNIQPLSYRSFCTCGWEDTSSYSDAGKSIENWGNHAYGDIYKFWILAPGLSK